MLKRLSGFKKDYFKPESRKKDYPHVENASFDDLISKSDIISFHCKAPKDGKPMITKEHYKKIIEWNTEMPFETRLELPTL